MLRSLIVSAAVAVAASPAFAFEPVTDRDTFVSLVSGKSLDIRLYTLSLQVQPDGQIAGGAMGTDVRGNWSWQDGYFCREMAWGDRPIPYNCQLVEVSGDLMRFTTDQGAGDSATFRLR